MTDAAKPMETDVTSPYLPVTGSAWRLALADVDGDGRNELAYATYQGDVRCINPATGRQLWEAPIGGFPFAMAAGDIDGDGRDEVLVASSGGGLHAFGPDGRALWVFRPNSAAMNQVALGRTGEGKPPLILCGGFDSRIHALNNKGTPTAEFDLGHVVHLLATVDFDGDGRDEALAAGYGRDALVRLRIGPGAMEKIGRIALPKSRGRVATPFSHCAAALDGDRRQSLVYGANFSRGLRVHALDASGQRATSPRLNGPPTDGFERRNMFCMTLVAAGDVLPDRPGDEVVSVVTGAVRIHDAAGRELGVAHAPVGFTDVVLDGAVAYLGSSPNGDETIYRIDLSADWQKQVASLERQGIAARIGRTLETMRQQVERHDGSAPADRHYQVRSNRMRLGPTPNVPSTAAWFTETFPYPGFEHITQCGSLSRTLADDVMLDVAGRPKHPPKANPDGYPVQTIVNWAKQVEERGIRCDLHTDHGCHPKLTHETLAKVIAASPTALRGFMSHEDENFGRIRAYCSRYIGPLADLCLPAGKEIAMQEKNVWWFAVPAMKQVYDGMLANGRGQAITAGCDNANSRTPELNLLGRFGLRQAGLIGHIQMSAISDLFCWSRMREWEYPKHGHPYLRLLVAGTALGADRFYIRIDNLAGGEFDAMTMEGAGLFFHMLGKGIVISPRPEQMVGTARVGFAVHEPSEKWLENNTSGHAVNSWVADEELDNAVVPHCSVVWGNTPTPKHALQAVLLHKRRQFGAHVPATPYGPFVFVPVHADLSKVPFVREWWHTDGTSVWREGGPKLSGEAAAAALRESFEAAAADLPFRPIGDDVFFQTIELAPGRYRIFAIDPGWLDPADRRITIRVQLPGRFTFEDVLSGEAIEAADGSVDLLVPAGALRIIDAIDRG